MISAATRHHRRRPPNRLPARDLPGVQPAGVARHLDGEPCGRAGLGPGGSHAPPARPHHGRAAGLYADWELWAADLAESHISYPVLLWFRSPEPGFSWILALLAVLDAAAMHLSLCPDSAPSQARMCLRMGFTALRRIARTLHWSFDADPSPDGERSSPTTTSPMPSSSSVETAFPSSGPMRRPGCTFVGWRVNYESLAYRLADVLVVAPRPLVRGPAAPASRAYGACAATPPGARRQAVLRPETATGLTRDGDVCSRLRRPVRNEPATRHLLSSGRVGWPTAAEEARHTWQPWSSTPIFWRCRSKQSGRAALERARALGCEHAEVRIERIRSQVVARLRDGRLETSADDVELGIGLRVVKDGSLGFAATVELTAEAAAALADEAVTTAEVTSPAVRERVELAEEPRTASPPGRRPIVVDPAEVPMADKVALLERLERRLLGSPGVDHVTACVLAVAEDKYYADLSGTVDDVSGASGVHPVVEATAVDAEAADFETMRTLAPPAGRGWEYLRARAGTGTGELAALPELLAEKVRAPTVRGRRLRPRDRPDEPLAHDPRVDRPRHRARPGPRLRGRLRRHVVRHLRPARHACATARTSCT